MSPKWVRRLSLLNIAVNIVIVVTGGAVRLTGSGLGCPSWPNCAPGTFHATAEMGVHGAIEWGNRLFGVIVGLVALATFIAAVVRRPRRRSLIWLTGIVGVGVVIQAGVGALTVNTGLAPIMVSVHFLLSMGVLTAAYTAWVRSGEPDAAAGLTVTPAVRTLWWVLLGTGLATILAGTFVTGAGPHAGDPDAPRLGLDSAVTAQIHADLVFLLVGLSVGLYFAARAAAAGRDVRRGVVALLVVEAVQGLIGMVQMFTGLPEILVGAHMLGASLLWLAILAAGTPMRERHPAPLNAVSQRAPRPQPAEEADEAAV